MAMKIAILDDYFATIRTLPCFIKLNGHDATIWNDHVQDLDVHASRPRGTGVRVPSRAAACRGVWVVPGLLA